MIDYSSDGSEPLDPLPVREFLGEEGFHERRGADGTGIEAVPPENAWRMAFASGCARERQVGEKISRGIGRPDIRAGGDGILRYRDDALDREIGEDRAVDHEPVPEPALGAAAEFAAARDKVAAAEHFHFHGGRGALRAAAIRSRT